MIVSLNWLKDYLDIDLDPEKVGEILTDIGLEVEGMETVEAVKGGLAGIVVGEVKTCGKHPNADKLSVTTVDVGREEALHIVCGAPNVTAGQKVLVAMVNTILYDKEGESFKIKKGKIRGEVSEGMICAEDELGLGNDHSGIMVLPKDAPVGMAAKAYLNLSTDIVYEIGLTPNRSDATNHLGVAKDLAAALKINYDHSGEVRIPKVDGFKIDNNNSPVKVRVENTEACPRYSGLTITDIKIQESPDWLKQRLTAIGVRPISNVVDITNFILHELGQPLHAFDLNEIAGREIIVKTLEEGSPFISLDEKERSLNAEDLMICDGNAKGMCIGGVFGGIKSGVKDDTTSIFLESAHFNAKWIRRTSFRHDLRTDAAKVFEKGSDPSVTVYALKRAAMLIKELAGGIIASEIVDVYPEKINPVEVEVSYKNVNRLIGVEIPRSEMKDILEALEMHVVSSNDTHFTVAVPSNKADVLREADVIEEILRIYGFNKVPIPSQMKTATSFAPKPEPQLLRNVVANYLSANGFSEAMALSLSESKYYQSTLPIPEDQLVFINNTSNVHLDIMRPRMLFSGLEAIVRNQNRQNPNLSLFEFGRTYVQGEKGIVEAEHLSLFITGDRYEESWHQDKQTPSTYYTLKAYVNNVLARLGLSGYQETVLNTDELSYGLSYHRGPQVLVNFGKVQPEICKEMGIKNEVYYADFQWDTILKALKKHKIIMEALNKYPSVRRDLALVVDNSVKFSDIVAIAKKSGKKLLKGINLFDVYESEKQLGKGKKSYAVSLLFEDSNKTLKDKEVDKVMQQMIRSCEQQLQALIRR